MQSPYKQLIPLMVASVVMFISLFYSMRIAGVGLLIWMIVLSWSVYKIMFKGLMTPADIFEANDRSAKEALDNGHYVQSGVYFIAFPLMAVGMIFAGMGLFVMIFLS